MRLLLIVVVLHLAMIDAAYARNLGQWDLKENETTPEERLWYQTVKQPDYPTTSCCGEADAYEANLFEMQGDQYVAIITDTRPDKPRKRVHRPVGTKIVVPNQKVKKDQPNPLGRGVIFLHPESSHVYCYFPPGAG
jgi:hypothetical protein